MSGVIRKRASACFKETTTVTVGGEARPGDTFRALVSVFGRLDSDGEVVDRGAFSRSLAERPRFPIFWSHMSDVSSIVGRAVRAEETDEGLLVEWVTVDTEASRVVAELLRSGAITDFSFSGELRGSYLENVENDDGGVSQVRHLTDIDLWEAGPCVRGANSAARLVSGGPDEPETPEDAPDDDSDGESLKPERTGARRARARLALLGL